MIFLYVFTFLAGLTTILSPCIWPILPVIFITASGGKKKPLGITVGVSISFAVLTLLLSYLLKLFSFDPIIFRYVAVIILIFLGLSLIVPQIMNVFEKGVTIFSSKFSSTTINNENGFFSGLVTGLALGIVWSPCAGPILATVATLASTQHLNSTIILMMLIYTFGLSIPLFLLALFGNKFSNKTHSISKHTAQIQKVFGIVVIVIAVLIATNLDLKLQAKIYKVFPNLSNLTKVIEDNEFVEKDLNRIHEELNKKDQAVACDSNDGKCKAISNDLKVNGEPLKIGDKAPEIKDIYAKLNTNGLEQQNSNVKVVEFWSMDCVNCIDVIPHLNEYQEKYAKDGLEILGVHTPEFEPEKDTGRLEKAIKRFDIEYPVIQDDQYKIWKSYRNRYWPTLYIINKDGIITYIHEGRGDYDIIEGEIKNALNLSQ